MAEPKKSEKPESQPKRKVAAKLFDDVKRPEDTQASATSKPIIVGHGSPIKDPMVAVKDESKSANEKTEEVEKPILDKPKKETVIQPLTPSEPDDPEEVIIEETQETEEVKEEVAVSENSNAGAVDAIVGTINTKKERSEAEEKQQVIDNEINELINSKKYNVKIRSAPNKRKARLLIVLLILAIICGGFWYLGMGPGKDLWLKDPAVSTVPNSQSEEPAGSNQTANNTPSQPTKIAFANSLINMTFSHPTDWKVEVTKDPENPEFDVITLNSPNEEIESIIDGAPPAKTEVFMRARIIVENTENAQTYDSDLNQLTNCISEDIIVGSSNLKLLLTDTKASSQNVSLVSLAPENCILENNISSANDQVQLSTKKNTYVIYAEYVLSDAYLEKNGIKEEPAVLSAQESGITTSKDAFKGAKSYSEFVELLKTLKEL